MKKKPVIILLLVVIAIAAAFGIFLFAKNRKGPSASGEDVRLYYYRCIPGLKRAEESGSVLSVRKGFALNDKGLRIEIDRLWIGADTAWALYHINDGTSLAPAGTLVLTGEDGTVLYTAAGEETEQILADDGLYGYFIMRHLDQDNIGTVGQASLYAVVTHDQWLSTKVTELDPIPIAITTDPADETGEDIPLRQESHELGNVGSLTPEKITLAESRTFLSMDWESPGYDLYGLIGALSSRTGESLPLDGAIDASGAITLPAFNYPDTLYTLSIDRAYLSYPSTLTMTIDPKDYRKRSSRNNIDQPAFQPGGLQCILDRIREEKDRVYLDMSPVNAGSGVLNADPYDGDHSAVYCLNGTSGWMEGALISDGDTLTISIPKSMWDTDLVIWVQVSDPLIVLETSLDIDLRGE